MVRFGYDGTPFHGWARQPGHRTIEGELRRGVARLRIADVSDAGRLEVASRTDRGVSARANALALTTPLPPAAALRALNGIEPALFFTAARVIPAEFRVRGARRRVYRYYVGPDGRDHPGEAAAAALFTGPVDVRSLGREVPRAVPMFRPVDSVTLIRSPDGGRTIEVRAPAFVWGEVRKIVGALREVDAGRLPLSRLRSALAGELRLTLPMAAAEPLVLWEVEYSEPWTHVWRGPNRWQRAFLATERDLRWSRSQWVGELGAGGKTG